MDAFLSAHSNSNHRICEEIGNFKCPFDVSSC